MLSHDMTFNFVYAKVCSPAIYGTYLSYHKDIRIAVTDYYMYFYLIMPLPLTAVLQFVNITAT